MIPWRYHLVSIMAIFLALGLGVVVGTTVINPGLVKSLNDQTDRLTRDVREGLQERQDLQSQLDTMSTFSEQAMPYLVGGTLVGEQVVIVTEEGVDAHAISQMRKALDLSGAEVLTMLTVRSTMAADSSTTKQDLAAVLGESQSTPAGQLALDAAQSLAERLAKDPRGDLPGSPDTLGDLLSQGFLISSSPGISSATLSGIGGRGQLVVTIGGGAVDELVPSSATFLGPFVMDLIGVGVLTGAGEGLAAADGFVTGLRSAADDPSAAALITVDNVDLAIGGSAMVLAFVDAILQGTGGDYGVKDGASRLLPPPA
ncbi:MAG: copper transporter [Actinomycetota bacterium]